MFALTRVFIKIFFRNRKAMFFVLGLPTGVYIGLSFLGASRIVGFDGHGPYQLFLVAGVLAYALMQAGIYTNAYATLDYRRAYILKRFAVTPATAWHYLGAQTLSRFLISILQAVLLLAVSFWVFGVSFAFQAFWLLPLILLITGTTFLNFGFIIASFTKGYEEAAPYTAMVSLTLVFLGDVFFPIAKLPALLAKLAEYLPLAPASALLRYSLGSASPPDIIFNVIVLLIWLALSVLIAQALFAKKLYK